MKRFGVQIVLFAFITSMSVFSLAEDGRLPANTKPDQNLDLMQEVLDKTKIKMGYYKLEDGPVACQSGTLRVVPIDDTVTIMLGAHALITSLGKSELKTVDRNCKSRNYTKYSAGFAYGKRVQICRGNGKKKSRTEFSVSLKPTPNGIEYTRITKENDSEAHRLNCTLSRTED